MHSNETQKLLQNASFRLLEDESLSELIKESTAQLLAIEPTYSQIGERTLADQMRKNISLTLYKVSGAPIPEALQHAAYETGQLRAIQQVELSALSRSFRIDLRVLWEAFLSDAKRNHLDKNATYISELVQVWEAVESNINETTEGYRATSEKLSRQDNQLKLSAFQRLLSLSPGSSYSSVAKQLSNLSFDPKQPIVCVVSDFKEADYTFLPLIQTRLSHYNIRQYFGWKNQHLIGILQSEVMPTSSIVKNLPELGDFRTGYYTVTDTKNLIDGIRNTTLLVSALDSAGIYGLHENWLRTLTQADPTLVDALVLNLFAGFSELTNHVQEELKRVIEAFLETGGTIAEIADETYRHRNTIRNRMLQIQDLTGLDLSLPRDIAVLALAYPVWRSGAARHDPLTP